MSEYPRNLLAEKQFPVLTAAPNLEGQIETEFGVARLVRSHHGRTTRPAPSPPIDGSRNVIAFPTQAVSPLQTPRLRSSDATGSNVVYFRPPHRASANWAAAAASREANVQKREDTTQTVVDYRQRMFENLLAAAASILLIVVGDWILSTLAMMP
jgi:hypothetical protein